MNCGCYNFRAIRSLLKTTLRVSKLHNGFKNELENIEGCKDKNAFLLYDMMLLATSVDTTHCLIGLFHFLIISSPLSSWRVVIY